MGVCVCRIAYSYVLAVSRYKTNMYAREYLSIWPLVGVHKMVIAKMRFDFRATVYKLFAWWQNYMANTLWGIRWYVMWCGKASASTANKWGLPKLRSIILLLLIYIFLYTYHIIFKIRQALMVQRDQTQQIMNLAIRILLMFRLNNIHIFDSIINVISRICSVSYIWLFQFRHTINHFCPP